jgi:uracil-DNA glycosylase family 4
MDSFLSEEGFRQFKDSGPIDLEIFFDEEGLRPIELGEAIKNCSACSLRGKYYPVLPKPNLGARIAIIGRGPSLRDVVDNSFFSDKCSFYRVMSLYLDTLGISREDVYVTNSTFCCPSEHRLPTSLELRSCSRFKFQELFLDLKDLKVILLMGETSMRQFLGPEHTLMCWCNTFRLTRQNGIFVVPIFHFSYYLSNFFDRQNILRHLSEIKGRFLSPIGEVNV